MTTEIVIERYSTHLCVRVTGNPSLATLLQKMQEVALATREASIDLLLADLRQVSSLRIETEQVDLGIGAARELAHLRKLASVVPAQRLTGVSQRVARDKGLDLRVFTSEEEALAWLLQPGDLETADLARTS